MADEKKTVTPLKAKNERFTDKPLGFVAALAAHAVLIFGLITVFQWNTEPVTFTAELWAPESASTETVKPHVKESVMPEEPAVTKPTQEEIQERIDREAQIRLAEEEKQKKLEEMARKKLEQERKLQEQKRALEAKKRREEAERRRQEELRKEELARILGASPVKNAERVGKTTGDMRVTTPNAGAFGQANYVAKVIAMLRSRIIFQVPAGLKSGERQAVYTVYLLPDGSQAKPPTLEKSSGLPAFDAAVESAIRWCNPFPPAEAGKVLPRTIQITFDPVDSSNNR